ncbi:MAG: GatB/YqeY domain-containing protein [Candidatus Dormibacteraceae bacterium]
MMAILEQVESELHEARRQRDQLRLRTLGLLKSELVRAGKEPGINGLDGQLELRVIRREVKRREEAAQAFNSGGRTVEEAAERAEAEVLRRYLPAELGQAELERLVRIAIDEVQASTPRDLGKVMKLATVSVDGRAEPGKVAAIAKRLLGG